MCGAGVSGGGASALRPPATEQQEAELRGNAAGEGGVDPGVGARVQTGQQHEQGEHRTYTHTHTKYN